MRYQGGMLLTVRAPVSIHVRRLALEAIRRHNSLEPELEGTHRVLLRWSESEGTGLPNPDAEVREIHFDPLPLKIQERVTEIIDSSPWATLTRKLYRTALTGRSEERRVGKECRSRW